MPPAVAHRLHGLALRGAKELLRQDGGGRVGDDVWAVLDQLNAAARAYDARGSSRRTDWDTVRPVVVLHLVPVREAAHAVGKSESYVQRLCRQRRIVASRTGRDWQVDLDSLRSVIGRSA